MSGNEVFASYLDVKVSAKARRGFTPWKAWHKQWCEIKRLDSVENGAELILRTTAEGAVINRVVLPRSSTVCRIESRSKQYAFGVFTLGRNQKPLLFLSGSCESDTQNWMSVIRKTLSVASYIPVGSLSFHVSLVDNAHSRATRLIGLFGILSVNSQEITISDPTTGEDIIRWKWHQFHQFHLQAVTHSEDEKTICVLHTSREFTTGPGQIHFYCKEAPRLLEILVTRGASCKFNPRFAASQRLSQSEGDLTKSVGGTSGSSECLRNLSNSDDSGVRVSLSSDDSGCRMKNKTSSMTGLLSKTPGGSEADDEDPTQDATSTCNQLNIQSRIPRGESGISLASGVYEEIPEILPCTEDSFNVSSSSDVYTNGHMVHLYEDPDELSFRCGKSCIPPPLPPRIFSNLGKDCDNHENTSISTPTKLTNSYKGDNFVRNAHKYRSNTLPAKDLRRLSQTFASDSDYMVMTPKNKKKAKNPLVPESLYVPMSPIANLKTKLENCYMVMSGKKC